MLVQFDVEQLAQLDRYAAEWTRGNRSRAIERAVDLLLAQHACYLTDQARVARSPHGNFLPAGPRHTTDSTSASTPLTAELSDL